MSCFAERFILSAVNHGVWLIIIAWILWTRSLGLAAERAIVQ